MAKKRKKSAAITKVCICEQDEYDKHDEHSEHVEHNEQILNVI